MNASITVRSAVLTLIASVALLALASGAGAQMNSPNQQVGKTKASTASDGGGTGKQRQKIGKKQPTTTATECRKKRDARDKVCDEGNRLWKDVRSCKKSSGSIFIACMKRV